MHTSTQITGLVFEWVLRSSAQAAVLTVLILLAQMIFRERLAPKWRHALWLLLIVRLVLPFSPPSSFSIFNFTSIEPTQVGQVTPAVLARPIDAKIPSAAPVSTAPIRPRSVLEQVIWIQIAGMVWMAGVGLFGLRFVGSNIRFSSRISRWRPVVDPHILRLFHQCVYLVGVRQPVTLIETAEVASPAVCGLFSTRVLLPRGLSECFSQEELRHIFLHELAHVKRRDLELNWIISFFQILHWFNPVLWFAFARMRADRELAADALALESGGEAEPISYGDTLIKVLEQIAGGAPMRGTIGIAEDKNRMAERLRAIARSGMSNPLGWVAFAIALVLAAVTLTDRARKTPEATAPSQTPLTSADERAALWNTKAKRGLEVLKSEMAKQEKTVELEEAKLNKLRVELNITGLNPDGTWQGNPEAETIRRLEIERISAEGVVAEYETIYNQLKEKSRADRRKAIYVAFPGDPALPTLFDKYASTEQELTAAADLGPEHPRRMQLTGMLEKMDQQINDRMDGLMQGLEVKIQAARERAKQLSQLVENAKKKDAEMAFKYQPYLRAKRDYDLEVQYLNVLKGRIRTETADLALPKQ